MLQGHSPPSVANQLEKARENYGVQTQQQTPKPARIQLAPQYVDPSKAWRANSSGGSAGPTIPDAPRKMTSHAWGDGQSPPWKHVANMSIFF